jgi:pimeloyl-ACP methyl ester carboxylesterase
METLDLRGTTLVGHSAGGREVARCVGRHGTSRVARVVLVGAVTPLMLKTAANPGGLPIETFDSIRAGVAADRSQFFIVRGDDDQIVPIGASAHASAQLVNNVTLKVYPGGSHGLAETRTDQLNADLIAFLRT